MPELQVSVRAARNIHDGQMIGRQDPYCVVQVGNRVFNTAVNQNGGTNPVWQNTFLFNVYDPQTEELDIVIKDQGWISDSHIGTARIPINAFLHGQFVDQWYSLRHEHHHKGEILLGIQLLEVVAEYAGQPQAMYQQRQTYGQQPPVYAQPVYGQPAPLYVQQQPGYVQDLIYVEQGPGYIREDVVIEQPVVVQTPYGAEVIEQPVVVETVNENTGGHHHHHHHHHREY
ncbi:Aste57867_9814 [Aphanomyces stellatus]|uniref:Aste57867_9814 protein n=1 Tax=Aphanomyces stellatus TaxID=120398 RepID=A0A485KNT4_9STRA|nr:hypothetical protein As57867_009775 [Aphanomyces stellatus]VFT86693.1 Aste57867_9814 [Aphanomyces stellatus]